MSRNPDKEKIKQRTKMELLIDKKTNIVKVDFGFYQNV